MSTYQTIRYETSPDKVATITLDRPAVLNAFDRRMCEEVRSAWHRVKDDPQVNAVVLRAAGERAFCAGLDVKQEYGQPDDVWNHEDPGELLSPKWQKVWKPVVCAVHGICTAGAFYFVNESDVVLCSTDATFFDSHVTYGMVSALEPVGLMRRIGLGETLRIALSGNDERVGAETALRIGLVTEVVERARLWQRAHEIAAGIASKPSAATQGTVRAIWESLDRPYRAAMEQGLIYTRLGNPLGKAEVARAAAAAPRPFRDPLMDDASNALGARIAAVLAIDPAAPAIEFAGRWRTWGELARTVESLRPHLAEPGTRIGVLLRNRPAPVALLLGALRAGACVVAIDPQRGPERTRDEIATLDLAWIAGEPDDLARVVPPELDTTALGADDAGTPVAVLRSARAAASRPTRPGVAVQMLTSGTTGPPKRVDLSYETLRRVLAGAKHYESSRAAALALRAGVAVVNSPLVHLGGLFRVLQCVSDGRSFALLERFTVEAWVDAVRRHRPATASLVPAALRMVLEADVAPADLASVRSVISGTAPLSPDDADAFRAKYGIPVLGAYAATEFGGGVAGWNLADHRTHWAAKRGSVGRAHAGCALRVVDPDHGHVLGADQEGLLEVQTSQLGPDSGWIRTTDLARIDGDGFLWILGRADRVIIRGGFKVHPDHVRAALERHPRVRGAAVVGRQDARLGAVPVAAVELRDGAERVTAQDLLAHAAATLSRYELPAEIRIVDALPRTPSAKVDLVAVGALLAEA